jgi:hypothetical protein
MITSVTDNHLNALVCANLRALTKTQAEEEPDRPGSAIESLIKPELDELDRLSNSLAYPAALFSGACADFMVEVTRITLNESPEDVLASIHRLAGALREELRGVVATIDKDIREGHF